MREIGPIVYRKFKGIFNRDDLARLRPTEKRAMLADGTTDVYVDKTGGLHRRGGLTQKLSGDYKWIWSSEDETIILAVKDEDLMNIIPEATYTESLLQANVGANRMVHCEVGSRIYCTNNLIIGYVENLTWNSIPVPSKQYKKPIPAGHLLEKYKAVMYIAIDNLLLYSDTSAYHRYDERNVGFQFPSKLTMVRAVDDGIYISDQTTTMFLRGDNPKKMVLEKVADYPAILGTDSRDRGLVIGNEFYTTAVLWTTPRGICIGGNGGKFLNLTEHKYIMPGATEGAGLIKRGTVNQYLAITRN